MAIRLKSWQVYLLIFLAGVLIGKSWSPNQVSEILIKNSPIPGSIFPPANNALGISTTVKVIRVIDGDTIEIEGGLKVRYIGIDTPETVDPNRPADCFGAEASAKNKELVEGRQVRLEKDVSETDRYGRLLRYVFVKDKGQEIMVNEELVRQGYAQSSSYPPDIKYQEVLNAAQIEARIFYRGLWGTCLTSSVDALGNISNPSTSSNPSNPHDTECSIKGNISTSGEKIYHLPGCGSYAKTVINENVGEKYFCSESEAIEAGFRKARNCP